MTNLNLTVDAGEIIALLGHSGSGKSTLLNLLSSIDTPDSGRIRIADSELTHLNERQRTHWRRRHLGFVFQFFNLIPTLTVIENIMLPLQLNQLTDPYQVPKAQQLLDEVGLADRSASFPEQLSGGEQQRLAIVRALIHQPQLLLADEPTGNLDHATGEQIVNLLLRLTQRFNTTVIIATHSDALAQHTDRVLQLIDGQLHPVHPAP